MDKSENEKTCICKADWFTTYGVSVGIDTAVSTGELRLYNSDTSITSASLHRTTPHTHLVLHQGYVVKSCNCGTYYCRFATSIMPLFQLALTIWVSWNSGIEVANQVCICRFADLQIHGLESSPSVCNCNAACRTNSRMNKYGVNQEKRKIHCKKDSGIVLWKNDAEWRRKQ